MNNCSNEKRKVNKIEIKNNSKSVASSEREMNKKKFIKKEQLIKNMCLNICCCYCLCCNKESEENKCCKKCDCECFKNCCCVFWKVFFYFWFYLFAFLFCSPCICSYYICQSNMSISTSCQILLIIKKNH